MLQCVLARYSGSINVKRLNRDSVLSDLSVLFKFVAGRPGAALLFLVLW